MATTTFSAAGAHRFAQAAGAAGAFSTLRLYDIRDAGRGGAHPFLAVRMSQLRATHCGYRVAAVLWKTL